MSKQLIPGSDAMVVNEEGVLIPRGIQLPHLEQIDTTDQSISNVNNAQVITFNTDTHHFGITITSSSRFTITRRASYMISFSGVCVGQSGKLLEVWLRINGVDVANSNTIYQFKATGSVGIVAVSFLEHFNMGDYFEFWTWGDDLSSTWKSTAAGALPTRPGCPCIIMTCSYAGRD